MSFTNWLHRKNVELSHKTNNQSGNRHRRKAGRNVCQLRGKTHGKEFPLKILIWRTSTNERIFMALDICLVMNQHEQSALHLFLRFRCTVDLKFNVIKISALKVILKN